MKTDQIFISSKDNRYQEVMNMTEAFTTALLLEDKDALRFRLLVEEALGMVQTFAEEFVAFIHFEHIENKAYIKLDIITEMDLEKKREWLSVSRTGKNSAARSFMGQIGEAIERGLTNFNSMSSIHDQYSAGVLAYGDNGVGTGVEGMDASFVWSLYQYKNALNKEDERERKIQDELEKSIVSRIADDVIVGIKRDHAFVTIIKNLDA